MPNGTKPPNWKVIGFVLALATQSGGIVFACAKFVSAVEVVRRDVDELAADAKMRGRLVTKNDKGLAVLRESLRRIEKNQQRILSKLDKR